MMEMPKGHLPSRAVDCGANLREMFVGNPIKDIYTKYFVFAFQIFCVALGPVLELTQETRQASKHWD